MSKDELAIVRNKKIGFVFQGFNLLSRTTALDNVELPLLYNGGTAKMKTAERHKRAMEVARGRSASASASTTIPNQLSGGQQQRVAIARALINEPSILLADEPTGNLDTRTSIEVMDIFQRLNQERGITVVLITHEMDIAEYGTRFVRFRDGRIQIDQQITQRRDAGGGAGGAAAARRRPSARAAVGDAGAEQPGGVTEEPHVNLDDAADRAQGAQPQQDAHRPDDARHDHRRRRRHHDGGARHRRADDDRERRSSRPAPT